MADNVIKFRRPEKRPEAKKPDPRSQGQKPTGGPPQWPKWAPWAAIVGAAVLLTLAQQAGLFGG